MRYYSDGKVRFVVFTNGTCALVHNDHAQPAKRAEELVLDATSGHVDFNPRTMDDGNYVVAFGEYVCGVVLAEEMKRHRLEIEARHTEAIRKDEAFITSGGLAREFDDRGKAGLLARARLFLDERDLTIVQICEPVR